MSCRGPMWQHDEVWYWICGVVVCSKSTVTYFVALFGTLIKTWMNQERVSECPVIWSQIFNFRLGYFIVLSLLHSFHSLFLYGLFHYILSILPRFHLYPMLLCVLRYFKVVQVSYSLRCSRTLTQFESLSDHHSVWENWNILLFLIFTMLGLRHSCVQRRWQHSWAETLRPCRMALCFSSSNICVIRARNQMFVNFTEHPATHINKSMT